MHVLLMSIATAVVLLAVVGYLASSNRLREKLYWAFLLLLLIGSGLMGTSAWFAGEAIYRGGVSIKANEPEQTPTTEPTKGRQLLANLDVMFPTVQTHVVFAGFAAAFALVAVGLSIRQITGDEPEPDVSDAEALVQSLQPPQPPPPLYPARFWLIAVVLFLLTALIGAYMLNGADTNSLKDIWNDITAPPGDGDGAITRSLAHFIAGSALIVLPLLLAIFARFAPKQKWLLTVCTTLLVLALAAQVWLGVLLLFDGPGGTIFRFAVK
jgi:heme A synthase